MFRSLIVRRLFACVLVGANSESSSTALLQFCLRHLDAPTFDAGNAQVPQRDPADWEWLKNVLANIESPVVRFADDADDARADSFCRSTQDVAEKLVGEIRGADVSDTSRGRALTMVLEELQDYAEDFDAAQHLAKIAAADIVALVEHATPSVRATAAFVIATCSLQNSVASARFHAVDALSVVMRRMRVEDDESSRFVSLAISLFCSSAPRAQLQVDLGRLGVVWRERRRDASVCRRRRRRDAARLLAAQRLDQRARQSNVLFSHLSCLSVFSLF